MPPLKFRAVSFPQYGFKSRHFNYHLPFGSPQRFAIAFVCVLWLPAL
jgi:hypothetical protein